MLGELRAVVEMVAKAASIDDALQVLVSQTRRVMASDCCSIYVSDPVQQVYTLRASDGLAEEAIGKVAMGFGEGLVGLVGKREEPINLGDARLSPHFKYLPETAEDQFLSFLGTPITHQRKVLGVLVVQQSQARDFDQSEEAFLVTLAAHLAGVLAHAEQQTVLKAPQTKWRKNFKAVSGSSGIAMAKAWLSRPALTLEQIEIEHSDQLIVEQQLLEQAIQATRDELHAISMRLSEQLPKDVLSIFDFYQHLLDDASLAGDLRRSINEGYTASSALKLVIEGYISQFEAMNDPYLKERALDVKDVGQRLLQALKWGNAEHLHPQQAIILVAEEVTATMFAELPREQLVGIVSCKGAANSHAAILARAMGLPALMGLDLKIDELADRQLIIDGYAGELFVDPDGILLEEYQQLLAQQTEINSLVQQDLAKPAHTLDGQPIQLLINAGLSVDSDIAVNVAAAGVGLYRTEVPFLMQDRFPSEQEQVERYSRILSHYPGKNVCMRTLDVGGDKQLPYFPIVEENPFLGWRGIRLTLDHPEIFLVQAKAMYRAALACGNLSIMLPMISSLAEVDDAMSLLDQAWEEVLEAHPDSSVPRPKHGVMLEVPSILYLLSELAERIDFWSVGSNDLTQYMLAVDRNNPRVAALFDHFHPAVVRALDQVIQAAKLHQVPVSVCGEMAGDPLGALLLLCLGYQQLSMSSFSLAKIKYLIRHCQLADLYELRQKILSAADGKQVHQLLYYYLQQQGLEPLVKVNNSGEL